MKIKTTDLIQELILETNKLIEKTNQISKLPIETLSWKESSEKWNVLECLEHLNLYGDFYLPEIKNKIKTARRKKSPVFKSGFIGNYFAESMLPKKKKNNMKTFKDKNPLQQNLDHQVVQRFLDQQTEFLGLLNEAKQVDLNRVKTAITISKIIRLKLGDTFRFLVNHNLRHFQQIENILLITPLK